LKRDFLSRFYFCNVKIIKEGLESLVKQEAKEVGKEGLEKLAKTFKLKLIDKLKRFGLYFLILCDVLRKNKSERLLATNKHKISRKFF
jgi:hypothetical protein